MPLAANQIDAGKAVRRALLRAERTHPRCPDLKALHDRLADLLEAFRPDLPDEEFVALGGGTPKQT